MGNSVPAARSLSVRRSRRGRRLEAGSDRHRGDVRVGCDGAARNADASTMTLVLAAEKGAELKSPSVRPSELVGRASDAGARSRRTCPPDGAVRARRPASGPAYPPDPCAQRGRTRSGARARASRRSSRRRCIGHDRRWPGSSPSVLRDWTSGSDRESRRGGTATHAQAEADRLSAIAGSLVQAAPDSPVTAFAIQAYHRAFDAALGFTPIPTARADLDLFRSTVEARY